MAPEPWSVISPAGGSLTRTRRHRATLRFRYDDAVPASAPHFDDQGVDEVLAVLVRDGLVRPVARMRPFAVLH